MLVEAIGGCCYCCFCTACNTRFRLLSDLLLSAAAILLLCSALLLTAGLSTTC